MYSHKLKTSTLLHLLHTHILVTSSYTNFLNFFLHTHITSSYTHTPLLTHIISAHLLNTHIFITCSLTHRSSSPFKHTHTLAFLLFTPLSSHTHSHLFFFHLFPHTHADHLPSHTYTLITTSHAHISPLQP